MVFVSEENGVEVKDKVSVNNDDEPDKSSEEKSSGSGLVEADGEVEP